MKPALLKRGKRSLIEELKLSIAVAAARRDAKRYNLSWRGYVTVLDAHLLRQGVCR